MEKTFDISRSDLINAFLPWYEAYIAAPEDHSLEGLTAETAAIEAADYILNFLGFNNADN